MQSMGVTRQLAILVAAFVLMTIVTVAGLSYQSHRSAAQAAAAAATSRDRNEMLFSLVDAVADVQGFAQRILREKDPDVLEKLLEQSRSRQQTAEEKLRQSGGGQGAAGSAYQTLVKVNEQVKAMVLRGEQAQAQQMFIEESNPAFDSLLTAIAKERQESYRQGAEEMAQAAARSSRVEAAVLGLALLGIGGLVTFAVVIVGRINRNLRLAAGELVQSADQMAGAAGQVSSASQALAQGASEQAASLEETSASSEEFNSMTVKNAESSQTAAQLMGVASRIVEDANQRLVRMMASMKDIGDSSEKISKIIRVIDEIAFQTNILALNAAVEAARAGEAGMGFAVVADEVRNLAQRCAQAARDTTVLIEESIAKSSEGSERLEKVAQAIGSITESAQKVRTLVDEVSASSQEQARGMDQISRAVAQMQQVTQRTAANAEQSAAAGEELNAQSEALRGIVGHLNKLIGAR